MAFRLPHARCPLRRPWHGHWRSGSRCRDGSADDGRREHHRAHRRRGSRHAVCDRDGETDGERNALADEIALATAYGEVWSDLHPERANWRISSAAPVPKSAFPALLLLPILDSWSAAAPADASGEIVVATNGATVTCTLTGPPVVLHDWLPNSLAYRLRVGLHAAHGDSWRLDIGDHSAPSAPALTLTLPLDARTPTP